MSITAHTPSIVPYGADETVYLVVDSLEDRSSVREIEVERSDIETVIADLTAGQFNDPVRVVAFNTLEHWSKDVSKDIARSKVGATSKVFRYLNTYATLWRAMPTRPKPAFRIADE